MAGFPGVVGSVDCTHIRWSKCSANLKQLNSGRDGCVTRGFEVTVNHKRKILAATKGHYGSYNDKTIVRFDDFILGVHSGQLYGNKVFEVHDKHGNVTQVAGLYLLSDNGYHKWRCLQCPMKIAHDYDELYYRKWSEMCESLRKDVECTFGILKVRFEILSGGIRLQNASVIDDIFQTCCALHNQLLQWDDLDDWKGGVPIRFATNRDNVDEDDDDLPAVFGRMFANVPVSPASEGMGLGPDLVLDTDQQDVEVINDHYELRQCLVEHFTRMFSTNNIVWPRVRNN